MALRKASAYALRSRPLGEADLIVELFTRERGRVRAVARSARRIRSRFGSAFEPFTRSRIVYFQRDKDDLGRVSSCDLERSYFEMLGDVEQAAMAAYMAELVIGFAPENDAAPVLYRLIGAVLDAMEAGCSLDLLARYFEVWVLRLSGLLPDLSACGSCGRPLVEEVWASETALEFICGRACGNAVGRRPLGVAARELLGGILRTSPRAVAQDAPTPRAIGGLGAVMELFVCGHLDRVPRSLRYARQIKRLTRTP